MEKNFYQRIAEMESELKAPKNLYNKFGNYYYRNAEGILEAVKPLLVKYKLCLVVRDSVELVGERYYIKAEATLIDQTTGEKMTAFAYAREALDKKGQDDSQITGTTSSYARKYALNGLLLLDDTKDSDTDENHVELEAKAKKKEEKKEEAKTEDYALKKIEANHLATILNLCNEKKAEPSKLLKTYGLNDLNDMNIAQFENAVKRLKNTK